MTVLLCGECHAVRKICAGLHVSSVPGLCEKCGRSGERVLCRMPEDASKRIQSVMYRHVSPVRYPSRS